MIQILKKLMLETTIIACALGLYFFVFWALQKPIDEIGRMYTVKIMHEKSDRLKYRFQSSMVGLKE